jgi:hypothetical protein
LPKQQPNLHRILTSMAVGATFLGGCAVGLFGGLLAKLHTGQSIWLLVGIVVGLMLGAAVVALQFRRTAFR